MLNEDLRAKARQLYGDESPRKVLRAWLSDATLCMILYRAMSSCNQRLWTKPLAFIFHKINAIVCGAVIGVGAQFGRRFVILHSVGIVINSAIVAGDDVTLESGVVIGAEKGRSPKIGNRVFFGSGAKAVGEIVIGNDVIIGANAVVVKDAPDSVVVGGVPAKIIRHINK